MNARRSTGAVGESPRASRASRMNASTGVRTHFAVFAGTGGSPSGRNAQYSAPSAAVMAARKMGTVPIFPRNFICISNPFLYPFWPRLSTVDRGLLLDCRRSAPHDSSMAWSQERLNGLVRELFSDARLVVVANREPYIHQRDDDEVYWSRPASGLVTALDPVMRACGGTWIAHGGGDADRETADAKGRLQVPPDRPAYTLRRAWLTKEEEEGYYYGFSNEALWPLCHVSYTRPVFNEKHWKQYQRVNRKFADLVLDEIGDDRAIVLVQDYHFALLPRMVKDARPDAVVCQFWHIPWPNREVFRICPWREELLHGLLGNDLL